MQKLLIAFFLFSSTFTFAQKKNVRTIGFYNVENLFDTLDTPNKYDEEFLPSGKKQWDSKRYIDKIKKINMVLDSMKSPIIVGFCEIENKQVVQDIVSNSINRKNYQIVHHESLDARGIDNAIIYDSTILTHVEDGFIRVELPNKKTTRDIVWGKFAHNKDTIIVFVNHWPSRRGGQVESEPKRLIAANLARIEIDSILEVNKKAKIIFMGDLNDYPDNFSVQQISTVLNPIITTKSNDFGGSNNYRGEWNVLDHMMISKGMTKGSVKALKKSGTILSLPFLLTTYKGNIVPFRTYGGSKYLKGYSDHLPVFFSVKLK